MPEVTHASEKAADPERRSQAPAGSAFAPTSAYDQYGLLQLQRSAGNAAVQRMMARGLLQRHNQPTIANPGIFDRLFGAGKKIAQGVSDAVKKKNEIDDILNKSTAGKAALKVIDDYKVPVDLTHPGPGSVYQGPAPGAIKIEATLGAHEAAFVLVHEAQHAKASNLGETADVTALTKDVYVKTMIDEETTSTVNSILAKRGMSSSQQKKLTATPVMEERYNAAYDKAHKAALAAKKKSAEAISDAEKAGWKSINEAFYDGSLVTSNTGETYAEYYGSFWEKVNNPPPPPPTPPPPPAEATPPSGDGTPPAPPTGG